jgi:hypothetical protein
MGADRGARLPIPDDAGIRSGRPKVGRQLGTVRQDLTWEVMVETVPADIQASPQLLEPRRECRRQRFEWSDSGMAPGRDRLFG